MKAEKSLPDERGFALIAVIFIAMLLALVTFVFTSAVRSYIHTAESNFATAESEAAADAGINLAVLDLVGAVRDEVRRRFPTDGTMVSCQLGQGELLTIRVRDEAGRVDLNTGGDALQRSLLIGIGVPSAEAAARIEALADYRDRDGAKRLNGAERDEYLAAGLAFGPKNAPLDAVEELARVMGFDSALLTRLRPYITLYSQQDGVDPRAASPELAAILARGAVDDGTGSSIGTGSENAIPPEFSVASIKQTFSIDAEVVTPRGARFVREAVVSLKERPQVRRTAAEQARVGTAPALNYRFWRWRRGETFAGTAVIVDISSVPAC